MSHYSVAVITKKKPSEKEIEEILAPYNEDLEVPQYVYATKEQIIQSERKKLEDYKKTCPYREYHADPEKYEKEHAGNPAHLEYLRTGYDNKCAQSDEELYQEYIRLYEKEGDIGPGGEILSTSNPDAKWDWYVIGGRYADTLPVGNRMCTIAKVSDVDWGHMSTEEYISEHPTLKEEYEKMISGERPEIFYSTKYLKERYPTLEDYILQEMGIRTYAVIVPQQDGGYEWNEAGRCLMFGATEATPEQEAEFAKSYYEKFIEPNMDKYVTIVDCHI